MFQLGIFPELKTNRQCGVGKLLKNVAHVQPIVSKQSTGRSPGVESRNFAATSQIPLTGWQRQLHLASTSTSASSTSPSSSSSGTS